jgi:hypothetical protein
MNKVLNSAAIILVGLALASCTPTTSSSSSSRWPSNLTESYITENTISENVISETTLNSEDFWLSTADIQRSPTAQELLLAPSFIMTPGRSSPNANASFDHMESDAFNGFSAAYSDPYNRGWAVIIYLDDEFEDSYGKGIGLLSIYSHASDADSASAVATMAVYISYTVTNTNTLNRNDIVTVKVGEFKFQKSLTKGVA